MTKKEGRKRPDVGVVHIYGAMEGRQEGEGVEPKEEDVVTERKSKTGRGRKEEGEWTVEHRTYFYPGQERRRKIRWRQVTDHYFRKICVFAFKITKYRR